MLYPIYVHQDEGSAFGATVPDFPGCFSAADNWADVPGNVQEAIELFCDGEDMEIPTPSNVAVLMDEPVYQDGTWIWVDIDTDALNTQKERINISVPANALREIDQHVAALGTTRSGFLVSSAIDNIRKSLAGKAVSKRGAKAKPRRTNRKSV